MKLQTIKRIATGRRIGLLAVIVGFSAQPMAQAALDLLPDDTANYAVLYEGSGSHNLQINSSPLNGSTILGNVGLATENSGNPQFQLNNPAVIDGNVNFAASPANLQNSGGVINGTTNSGVAQVNTDMSAINTLSTDLGGLSGAGLTVNLSGTGGSQTIDASSGTFSSTYDSYVFNLTSLTFNNGNTITVDGQSLGANVVINVNVANISNPHFAGTIALAGGLTANNLIINLIGGNTTTLTGGPTLQTAANHAVQDVTYLDPTGTINVNSVAIMGHLFGGDSADMQITSGGTVQVVPEPTIAALGGLGAISMILLRRRKALGVGLMKI